MFVYSLLDFIVLPVYLIVILMAANIYSGKKMVEQPCYAYFTLGLLVKIIGGLGVALVYTLYYPGGDTTEYFRNVTSLQNLAFYDLSSFWHVMTETASNSSMLYFNNETGYACYARDPKAWAVVKMALPLVVLSFQSYLTTTVLCATVSFAGIWKLYKVFVLEFPELKKEMAISFLFIPSVFFGVGFIKGYFYIKCIRILFFKFVLFNCAKGKSCSVNYYCFSFSLCYHLN